ncbi:MAG: DUF386 family protein [Ruminococcaceae bacterium]|nr:DUF386 family protein [Oscillospiraceae bacterium]
MIVANIKDAERYYSLNPNFKDVFAFLKTLRKDSPEERFVFDSFKGHVASLTTSDIAPDGKPKSAEAHKDYLDIHYVIAGREAIGYADINTLQPITEYDSEQDYLLLTGDMYKVFLGEGDFCIVFPEDAHAPGMCAGDDGRLKKAVVKLRLG